MRRVAAQSRRIAEQIPLGARIADTFTSARPYREAHSPNDAMVVLAKESGRTLDPAVVAAFFA